MNNLERRLSGGLFAAGSLYVVLLVTFGGALLEIYDEHEWCTPETLSAILGVCVIVAGWMMFRRLKRSGAGD